MTTTTELRRSLHPADLAWEAGYRHPRVRVDWLCLLAWLVFVAACVGVVGALALGLRVGLT